MRPRLKQVGWQRTPDGVELVLDPRESVELSDPDGAVARLVELLEQRGRTVGELAAAVRSTHPSVTDDEVNAAVEALDDLRLLEDDRRTGGLTDDERLRHFSNLAFFRTFGTLALSAEDMVARLRESHVLMLGVGGLGSNVLQNLCGLGVGRLTLVDLDMVEPRNFARQFVYRAADIGRPKVERAAEWVREYDPSIGIDTRQQELCSTEDVAEILAWARPDAVSAGVDQPDGVDDWVNEACVRAGVPYCRGGMYVTEAIIRSVDPRRSACLACLQNAPKDEGGRSRQRLAALHQTGVPRINRGAGPVATLLGSLVAFELARFVTGFRSPVYAGAIAAIDLAGDCGQVIARFERDPDCEVCGEAALQARSEALQGPPVGGSAQR